ncbi:putative telomerase reverse transcriptase protein [Neofusicoccum parvum UCRNP2]|uniref:Telomerase reverse transcriptase n=1 Tax=Botryosphaeria parva (strain UCR-NP2) TaxID=1287680 RepID=R1GLU3_BOTPV|nr:putative telomerase reverse transcriptase protein [Neofusicoccum parvum UCRNP2]
MEQQQSKNEVMKLLTEHVERNIVKVGKKYYRQKTGIPQEREHAERFLQIMYEGNEDYGISIKKDKTLTNFTCRIGETEVPRLPSQTSFPYCGIRISTRDLNITKDFQLKDQRRVRDGLTVEFSKLPGQTFHRKTLK